MTPKPAAAIVPGSDTTTSKGLPDALRRHERAKEGDQR